MSDESSACGRGETRRGSPVRTMAMVLAACTAICPFARAAFENQVGVGPRALGMGSAYVAVADDATALYWNPAGLPQIDHQEILGTQANLWQSGIRDKLGGFILPVTDRQVVGIDWYRSNYVYRSNDAKPNLGFQEDRIDLGYGVRFFGRLGVGITAKTVTRKATRGQTSVREGKGWGYQLGVLANPWRRIRLGLTVREVGGTPIKYDGGVPSIILAEQWCVGAAADVFRWLTLASQDDGSWHFGGELRPHGLLALRGGIEESHMIAEGPTWSYGAGVRLSVLRFDYARVLQPDLPSTDHFGLSLNFQFNPSRIKIERAEAAPVYASLYKSYARDPVGSVVLRNLSSTLLPAQVSLFLPRFMDAPTEQNVVLMPGQAQEVALPAVFSGKILSTDSRPVQLEAVVTYEHGRRSRTIKRAVKTDLYSPGQIHWGRGVGQAAAFVDPRDAVVDAVARRAVQSAVPANEDALGCRNLRHAAALFDALQVLGITYVPDPLNPFSAISENPRAVDSVRYPRETLAAGSGDCDDLSVLYAALLANVGVVSMLVDAPGHIFLLVDTGLHETHRLALGLDQDLYVIKNDGVWIPFEATAIQKGFSEAWRTGAETYRSLAARGQAVVVDLAEAQQTYIPAEPPSVAVAPKLPDPALLAARTREDAARLGAWRKEFLQARYGKLDGDQQRSVAAMHELARVYFLGGDLDRSDGQLQGILQKEPQSASAQNNVGVLRVASGRFPEAIAQFESALRLAPDDAGICLNLGFLHYLQGDSAQTRASLAQGIGRAGGLAQACQMVGLREEETAGRKEAEQLSAAELRRVLQDALETIPVVAADSTARADTSAASVRPATPAVRRAKPLPWRTAGSRAWNPDDLRPYLYWKE